ncbi:LOW QUALITY PROTEIN: small heat shock protein hspG3-like [Lucilia sericata]|uniref:LOW QUALITY PROTEIN: small heat shock protein hspG3-like n=1 Tax=Lucilia sericata TaxID=13632 RepID=UPI0018A85250|nr:LOW QUALITY PROTEIN: small heat shock protein hspG3-like [Lucilia sericata]
MSHFSTILENLRMVAIKRSPLTQQKQKQQQQQQQQQQQAVTPTSPQPQQHVNNSPQVAATTNSYNDEASTHEPDVKINNDNKQFKVFINNNHPHHNHRKHQHHQHVQNPRTITTMKIIQ